MKVSFEERNMTDHIEGAIKLTNDTSKIIQNISLSFEVLTNNLMECKVIRERGSLSFGADEYSIPLGNLYPEEVAYLYCKLTPSSSADDESNDYATQIKLTFMPEDSTLATHALSDLLSRPTSINRLKDDQLPEST